VDALALLGVSEMEAALQGARTIAVLGIKPESRRALDAHQIPLYLHGVGYTIVPVPIRYPEALRILDRPVYRRLSSLPMRVDILNVFCKPKDFEPYLTEALALKPGVVWFQSGLLALEAMHVLRAAGIPVAEDCIGCRRATLSPSCAPLPGQEATRPR
jgi:uncharacterized protein